MEKKRIEAAAKILAVLLAKTRHFETLKPTYWRDRWAKGDFEASGGAVKYQVGTWFPDERSETHARTFLRAIGDLERARLIECFVGDAGRLAALRFTPRGRAKAEQQLISSKAIGPPPDPATTPHFFAKMQQAKGKS